MICKKGALLPKISPSLMIRFTGGERNPSIRHLIKIAENLNVNLHQLFLIDQKDSVADHDLFLVNELTSMIQKLDQRDRELSLNILREIAKNRKE